ncbi:MAG: glycosyltransferase, partial [Acidobacteria bacterium]
MPSMSTEMKIFGPVFWASAGTAAATLRAHAASRTMARFIGILQRGRAWQPSRTKPGEGRRQHATTTPAARQAARVAAGPAHPSTPLSTAPTLLHDSSVPTRPASSISVLICTYNRAERLEETLAAFGSVRIPDGSRVEMVVVDNHSTDATAAVLARHARRLPFPMITAVETRQGKSFALNTGLALATGEIVALTDDDVVPDAAWLEGIARAFRRPGLTFAFGKVLPRWEQPPPPRLLTREAQAIWGPLALVDYGDREVRYVPDRFGADRFPIGANLAFTRAALRRVGGWRNDLGKVDNSLIAGEDYEIFHRLRRAGLFNGLYDPSIVVHHFVPASRVSRRYFRRWFYWNGRTIARMLPDYYDGLDFRQVPLVAGVPRFLYRQALGQAAVCLRTWTRRDPLERW